MVCVYVIVVLTVVLCVLLVNLEDYLSDARTWAVALVSSISAVLIICILILARQPQAQTKLSFKVTGLP